MNKLKEVKFRLTEEQWNKANKNADHYGMSINALAKHFSVHMNVPTAKQERADLKELNRHIGAIGNNLNQIARRINANSTLLLPSEKQELLAELKEIRKSTLELVGRKPLEEKK